MVEWHFEVIHNITSNRKLLGTIISPEWQMWDEAYFKRVSDTLADPTHTAKLMAEGCNNGDLGELNCTKTCDSADYMFRSPQNLWNCMTLSTVAMKVIPQPTNDTVNQGSEKDMDDMFHFGSLRNFDRLFAFREVRECLWQSCSDSKYGKCTEANVALYTSSASVTLARYFQNATAALQILGSTLTWLDREQNACPLVKWLIRFCRQFPSAITSTLIDLQETQTLFAATISVATIVAFHCYTGLANVASISSYVLNNEIALSVIIIGMIPLLLLQLVLHASEHTSKYTLGFVFLNWLFIVIKSALQKGGAVGFEKTLKRQSSLPSDFRASTDFLLLMDWALATLHGFYEKGSPPNTGSCVQNFIKKKALAILTAFLAIVPMAFGLADLVQFYKGLRDRYTPEGGLPWSFGQVTAVAVWFPVVCKFLHYCVVKDGVQARIDKDEYVVSRRETAVSELKSSGELGLDNTSLIGPVVPGSMGGAEPIEMRASLDASAENLLMRPHAG
ncbi:hypothetical protein FACUT_8627 [Fusarium acutatum]|uniref:Uncharacterized protein n=1 Tax=Fusarium acutatum TaxID=78861 RepID=A0A8H4NHU8_9HYPO|nr:hypothetical protein FACUT_8627 [Fusarium acutatum]